MGHARARDPRSVAPSSGRRVLGSLAPRVARANELWGSTPGYFCIACQLAWHGGRSRRVPAPTSRPAPHPPRRASPARAAERGPQVLQHRARLAAPPAPPGVWGCRVWPSRPCPAQVRRCRWPAWGQARAGRAPCPQAAIAAHTLAGEGRLWGRRRATRSPLVRPGRALPTAPAPGWVQARQASPARMSQWVDPAADKPRAGVGYPSYPPQQGAPAGRGGGTPRS